MCLLIFLGRLIYIPFIDKWDIEFENGFFGFKWFSTFLSRIGNEVSWVSVGFFIKFLLNYINVEAIQIKKYTNWMANLILIVALYFIFWIFYDNYNFSITVEILFASLTSVAAFYVVSKFFHPLVNYIQKLLGNIRMLTDVIILKAPQHVKDKASWEKEIVEPTLDKLNE